MKIHESLNIFLYEPKSLPITNLANNTKIIPQKIKTVKTHIRAIRLYETKENIIPKIKQKIAKHRIKNKF